MILVGQSASALGDAVAMTALPLVVLNLTGSGALLGVVGALELLPALLFGLPSGALADRLDKRQLLMWADVGRAVLTIAVPVAIWLDASPVLVLLLVTAPVSALRVLFESAFASAVPPLVGRENLGRAMGYMESVLSVPFIIGPALAGLLLTLVGPAWTLTINAASFAVSGLSLLLVRRRLVVEGHEGHAPMLADILEGLRFVRGHAALRWLIGYVALAGLTSAGILPALSYFVTVDVDLGSEVFGLVGSVWSVGYLLGSLVAARLGNRLLRARLLAAGALVGSALLLMALSGNVVGLLVGGFLVGAGLALELVAYATLRASYTPDALLGRVGSTARTITLGLQPLAVLLTGLVLAAADGRAALLAMGVLGVLASTAFAAARVLRPAGVS